jgi:hypothetical protein
MECIHLRHYTVYAYIAHAHAIGLGNWPVEIFPVSRSSTQDGKVLTTFAYKILSAEPTSRRLHRRSHGLGVSITSLLHTE